MTTIMRQTSVCYLCGAENEYGVVASTNSFGPTDLDTRPPEMQRSTMPYWVQACPACGYAAVDVSDDTTVGREFLKTKAYRQCGGIRFASGLAKAFYRHYLIMAAEEKDEEAFWALMHAAWASDDKDDADGAAAARKQAADTAARMLETGAPEWSGTLSLIRADLLRRTGRFDELLAAYSAVEYSDGLMNRILAFEKELARRKITGCLTVGDSENYAAGSFDRPDGEEG